MLSEHLKRDYYYSKDGNMDSFVALLSCFQAPLYFMLKAKFEIETPYEIFLQNPSFSLISRHDRAIEDIRAPFEWPYNEIFEINYFQGSGYKTFAIIEKMLDQGEMVMFSPLVSRVPYFKYFISKDHPYDPSIHNNPFSHICLALTHNEEELFYAEGPWGIHPSNFIPYQNSKCIGVIRKEELKEAFDGFLNYRTVEIKQQALGETSSSQRLITMLKYILDNFHMPPSVKDGCTYTYNNEALKKLVQYCDEGLFELAQKSDLYDLTECGLLEWKFSSIRQKKTILITCIKKYKNEMKAMNLDRLIQLLEENIQSLVFLTNKLRKMDNAKKYIALNEMKTYFEKIILSEAHFIAELENSIEKNIWK
jgi:hypothetical protein